MLDSARPHDRTFESFVTTLVASPIAGRASCESIGTHVYLGLAVDGSAPAGVAPLPRRAPSRRRFDAARTVR